MDYFFIMRPGCADFEKPKNLSTFGAEQTKKTAAKLANMFADKKILVITDIKGATSQTGKIVSDMLKADIKYTDILSRDDESETYFAVLRLIEATAKEYELVILIADYKKLDMTAVYVSFYYIKQSIKMKDIEAFHESSGCLFNCKTAKKQYISCWD